MHLSIFSTSVSKTFPHCQLLSSAESGTYGSPPRLKLWPHTYAERLTYVCDVSHAKNLTTERLCGSYFLFQAFQFAGSPHDLKNILFSPLKRYHFTALLRFSAGTHEKTTRNQEFENCPPVG